MVQFKLAVTWSSIVIITIYYLKWKLLLLRNEFVKIRNLITRQKTPITKCFITPCETVNRIFPNIFVSNHLCWVDQVDLKYTLEDSYNSWWNQILAKRRGVICPKLTQLCFAYLFAANSDFCSSTFRSAKISM